MRVDAEKAQAAADAFKRHGYNISRIAADLRLSRSAARDRVRTAAAMGLLGTAPVLPGFEISGTTTILDRSGAVARTSVTQRPERGPRLTIPPGMKVDKLSVLSAGDGSELLRWSKLSEGVEPLDVVEALKAGLDGYSGPGPAAPAPAGCDESLLNLLALADWHLGLYTWLREVGVNWDLRIAEERYNEVVDRLVERAPAAGTAILLGGGDLIHSDNFDNRTAKSGNALDVDGRYPKVVQTAGRMVVRTVYRLLDRHEKVIVRMLKGNHDEHSAIAISYFLLAWFRSEPRVEVDVDPSLFFWHRFGKVFLGATHGHTLKPEQMPAVMAARRPEDWGASRHRFIHTFHRHHKARIVSEGGGAIVHIHRSPAPQDEWHFGAGFVSGRSMEITTYHRERGERGASIEPLHEEAA